MRTVDATILDALARWLEYPAGQFEGAREAARGLETAEARRHAESFLDGLEGLEAHEREELYCRTFDINPVCSLEVGWHIFGETYDRGGMLVKLRGFMREHGVEENTELPDHLPQVLRLFARLDAEQARNLAVGFITPAIDKMSAAFDEGGNPYHDLLKAVALQVAARREALEEALQDV